VLADGTILTTEIGDNADPPVEEVNVIDPTQPLPDFGWPTCAGDDVCPGVVGPLSIFPSSATPTGIATVGDDGVVRVWAVDVGEWIALACALLPTTRNWSVDRPLHEYCAAHRGPAGLRPVGW
jgi:hypothetical protein